MHAFLPQQITELRQKLTDSQKAVMELEAEREQKQRDFDRKLLLAKSKIEEEEVSLSDSVGGWQPNSSQIDLFYFIYGNLYLAFIYFNHGSFCNFTF